MSYLTQNEIASNPAMQNRIAQAVTAETDPIPAGMTADNWTITYRREWGASPGWDAAWESARVSHPDPEPGSGEPPYDPGEDEGVITDGMILAQVQSMLTAQDPEALPEGSRQVVLDWVGTDPGRAQKALDAEQASESPRSTLVTALEKIATTEGTDQP